MAPNTACLFFRIIFIALQFCYVSCYDSYLDQVSIDYRIDPKFFHSRDMYFSCEKHFKRRPFTCKFQLTDGTFIEYKPRAPTGDISIEVVDNATYKYTINYDSTYQNGYPRCSITIHEPFDQLLSRDTVKCWIITEYGTFSGIHSDKSLREMEKTASTSTAAPIISSNKVHVKRGDNFKIGCQVMQPIDYCFLQSPNGTMFAVAYSNAVPKDPSIIMTEQNPCTIIGGSRNVHERDTCVKYLESQKKNKHFFESFIKTQTPTIDSEFSIGDCFTVIENADDSHNGNWRCQLGLQDTEEEIQTIVPVTVEESYLLTSVEKDFQTAKTVIKCTAVPTLRSKIINCRWTLPNGTGIYKKSVSNIEVSHNDTSCVLKLNDWNDNYKGTWSCFAVFENDFKDEFHASNFISI